MLDSFNKQQKSDSSSDLLQGVHLPDVLHTLAEPALSARDLLASPPQPAADRRSQHQLVKPANTAGTSFVRY